jgi:cellulose synthase/poly-beta-1,6-N-acetylglucosamine synthase-like glycosyltransferase
MESVFWISVAVIVYVYAGYPLLLAAWARLAARAPRKADIRNPHAWPSILILVAARNEASRLSARIANLLHLSYPGACEILIISDGSTDHTVETVASFVAEQRTAVPVRVIQLPPGGKPAALNAGVAASTGEILVFADARQRFASDALVELVANFNDPRVGGVTGELLLDCELGATDGSSIVAEGVGAYWKYEKWLRRNESAVWSTLGATGAIYALRRSIWQPLPSDTLLDDVLAPMRAVLAGFRIVFEERARAFDRVAPDAASESRRKTRTLAGNYQILAIEPRLLIPFVNPVWLQFVSHKFGRLLVPWALVSLFLSTVVLAQLSWLFAFAFAAQLGFYGLAVAGALVDARRRHRSDGRADLPVALGKGTS